MRVLVMDVPAAAPLAVPAHRRLRRWVRRALFRASVAAQLDPFMVLAAYFPMRLARRLPGDRARVLNRLAQFRPAIASGAAALAVSSPAIRHLFAQREAA